MLGMTLVAFTNNKYNTNRDIIKRLMVLTQTLISTWGGLSILIERLGGVYGSIINKCKNGVI